MNDRRFVQTVLDFTGFHFGDRLGDVHGDRARLRVRHEAFRAEHFTDAADDAHHVGRGDHDVEIEPVLRLDLLDHLFRADEVCTGLLRDVRALALGDDQNLFGFARAVGQNEYAANLLVCLAGINTQTDVQFDGFVELRLRGFDRETHRLVRVV